MAKVTICMKEMWSVNFKIIILKILGTILKNWSRKLKREILQDIICVHWQSGASSAGGPSGHQRTRGSSTMAHHHSMGVVFVIWRNASQLNWLRTSNTLSYTVPRCKPYQFFFGGHLMENIYLVPPIGPGNTIACLHSAVGTVNDGVLQTVCESVRRVTKRIEIGRGFF
jgi:hypothetical protein